MRMHTWRVLCLIGGPVLLGGCVAVPGNYYGSSLDPYCCASSSTVYYDTYNQGRYYDPYYGAYYGPSRQPYYPAYGSRYGSEHRHDRYRPDHDREHSGRRPPDRGYVATSRPDSPRTPPAVFDPPRGNAAKPPPRRNRGLEPIPHGGPQDDPPPISQADRDSLPARLLQQHRDRTQQQAAPDRQAHRDAHPKPDVRTLLDQRRR